MIDDTRLIQNNCNIHCKATISYLATPNAHAPQEYDDTCIVLTILIICIPRELLPGAPTQNDCYRNRG